MTYLLTIAAVIFLFMWFSTGFFTWAKFMWCCGESYTQSKGIKKRTKYLAITLGLIVGWPVFYYWLAKKTKPEVNHVGIQTVHL